MPKGTTAKQQFQSTPPRGRRLVVMIFSAINPRFQSTPPRGRRPCASGFVLAGLRFNPRLREGGDLYCRN